MEAPATESQRPVRASSEGHRGKWIAGVVALALVASAAFPVAVVLLGVLLVTLVALDSGIPGLIPGLRPLLRVPIAPASRRRARLMLAGSCGVLLVVFGTAGAKFGGQLRTAWKLHQAQRQAAEEQVAEHLERARKHLAAGEVELAELTLMDVDRIAAVDHGELREVDELLGRVRRSGDSEAILDILLRLPPVEFEAFARGESVPEALEFRERALTYRAVELARTQIDTARATRASP